MIKDGSISADHSEKVLQKKIFKVAKVTFKGTLELV